MNDVSELLGTDVILNLCEQLRFNIDRTDADTDTPTTQKTSELLSQRVDELCHVVEVGFTKKVEGDKPFIDSGGKGNFSHTRSPLYLPISMRAGQVKEDNSQAVVKQTGGKLQIRFARGLVR